jgi:hypothetical protein
MQQPGGGFDAPGDSNFTLLDLRLISRPDQQLVVIHGCYTLCSRNYDEKNTLSNLKIFQSSHNGNFSLNK